MFEIERSELAVESSIIQLVIIERLLLFSRVNPRVKVLGRDKSGKVELQFLPFEVEVSPIPVDSRTLSVYPNRSLPYRLLVPVPTSSTLDLSLSKVTLLPLI
jgi:hypothetical protein